MYGSPGVIVTRQTERVHLEGTKRRQIARRSARPISALFRRVLAASIVSQLGSQVGFLAFPLVATSTLGATAFDVAMLYSLGWLPYLVFFAPMGKLVDRGRRVPLMIAADGARCLLVIALPVLYFAGHLALWQLYLVVLLAGLASAIFDIADQAFLPAIVDAQDLLRANVLLETSNSATRIVGPGAAGVVIGAVGAPAALVLDGASYFASAALLNDVRRCESPPAERATVQHGSRPTPRGGFAFVFGNSSLRALLLSKAVANFGWAFVEALLVVYAVRVLHVDAAILGVIFVAGNLGLLAGTTVARRLTGRAGRRAVLMLGIALQGLGVIAVALAATTWAPAFLGAGLATRAFGLVLYNVNQTTERQTVTPPELLGSVGAAMRVGDVGVLPIGYLVGGALASVLPLREVLFVAAGFTGLAFVLITALYRDVQPQAVAA